MASNKLSEKPLGSKNPEIEHLYHLFIDALHQSEDEKREHKPFFSRRTGFVADPFPSDIFKRSLARLISEPGEAPKAEEEQSVTEVNKDITTIIGGPEMSLRRFGMLLLLLIDPTLFPLGDFKSLKANIKYPLFKKISNFLGFPEPMVESISHHVYSNLREFGVIDNNHSSHKTVTNIKTEQTESHLHGSCEFFTFNHIDDIYSKVNHGIVIYDQEYVLKMKTKDLALEANYLLLIGDFIQRNKLVNHYCALSYVAKSFLHLLFNDSSPWIPLVVDKIKQLV